MKKSIKIKFLIFNKKYKHNPNCWKGKGMIPKAFEESSEIDFNNKKYYNLNENPAALSNNISNIKQNDTIRENDNISWSINNLKINEEEEDYKNKIS